MERSSGTLRALPSGGEEPVVAHLAGERRKEWLPRAMHPAGWRSSGPGARAASLEDGERPPAGDLHPCALSDARWRGVGEEARDTNENKLARVGAERQQWLELGWGLGRWALGLASLVYIPGLLSGLA